MPTPDDDTCHETVTVALPGELLREIDEFATHNGYESPDAVVAAALAAASEADED